MNILEKIDQFESDYKLVTESGIRNITDLSKKYKEAEIYFHKDLDGVTSAIGMKEYLKRYGIKVIDAHPINYGSEEYAVPKPKSHTLHVMVDFAHGKPVMHIHTDHHDAQVGHNPSQSTSFVKSPSNAAYISQVLSPQDLFPPADTRIINTVDSADFASQGLEPEDIMRATFKVDPKLDVSKNRRAMGLVVNTLTLAYKNKKGFLSKLVLQAKPSLQNMFTVIKRLAKEAGYKPPEDVEADKMDYVSQQKDKFLGSGKPSDVKNLKNGQNMMIGTTIVQYGGGSMFKGYDRYTPFKNNPDAHYLLIAWPMGLIQFSKNPFKKATNPHHLGEIAKKLLNKWKSRLSKEIDLATIKRMFEQDADVYTSMGFTFDDLTALYEKDLKGLVGSDRWKDLVRDITNQPFKKLSPKQKDILKKITINLYDIIVAGSGGHKDITNISGFNFYGKGYVDLMKEFMVDVAKELKNLRLQER